MPSTLHQALVGALADDPALAFDLMREVFDVHVPPLGAITDRRAELDVYAPCFGDTPELRPDLALSGDLVRPSRKYGRGVAMIVEVQKKRDALKRWRMWVYRALLAERLRRTTAVLLVTLRDDVAKWARGLDAREIRPRDCLLVLDRQNMPRVTSIEEARQRPSKAVLSALLHAREDDIEVMSVAFAVAQELPDDRRWRYGSAILAAASERRRDELLGSVKMRHHDELTDLELNSIAWHDGHKDGKREGILEGKREGILEGKREGILEGTLDGLVRLLLTILELRQLPLDPSSEQRIRSCTDPELLERWAVRARQASSVAELF